MKVVRGAVGEQDSASRKTIRARRRVKYFADKIRDASSGAERIQQACYYAQAVGSDLNEHARNALAKAVAEVADRWNPK